MEPEFDERKTLDALGKLPFTAVLAFALSCAERLYPNYVAFHRKLKWGDPEGLRRALDLGWTVAAAKEPGPGALQDAHAIVDAATPDTADFDSLYVSPALDAATATLNVLDFIRNREPGLVAQTASLCRDTVDMYVQEKEGMDSQDPDLEAQILRHPLMQRELERQRLDLQRAAALASGQETLERLRGEWRQPKKSNLDLA